MRLAFLLSKRSRKESWSLRRWVIAVAAISIGGALLTGALVKKECINLNEIIKGAVEDIKPEYKKKGVKLGTKIQTRPIFLDADPVRITQIRRKYFI